MNIRQDAWLEQDDLTLAETVLTHIRKGSTQLAAFEETAERLSRTSAACGFRWNSEVRKKYELAIKAAKEQRKNYKGSLRHSKNEQLATVSNVQEQLNTETDYADLIISATGNLMAQNVNMAKQIKILTKELDEANKRILVLEDQLYNQNPEKAATEDYQALIQILERARKIGALDRISG